MCRRDSYGPSQTQGHLRMACPMNSQTSPNVFRIWKFLLKIYSKLFDSSQTFDNTNQERNTIQVGWHLQKCFPRAQTTIYRRAHFMNSKPTQTIPTWMQCIRSSHRSSIMPKRIRQSLASLCLPIQILHASRTKLLNLWMWITFNNQSVWSMVTLSPRVTTPNRDSYRS